MHRVKRIKSHIIRFLLWTQKYTKADMLYIAKGGFWVMLGQGVNALLSLGLLVAFANLLPKEIYGTYRYILSIAGVLSVCTLTGMNSAVAREVARGSTGILKETVRYQLKWNTLMFASFIVLSVYYFFKNDITLTASLFFLGISTPLTLAFNTYGAYLEGKKEFQKVNVLSIASTGIYTIGMLLVLLCTRDVIPLIATYAAATLIPSVLFYFYILRTHEKKKEENADDVIRYGKTLTYIKLLGPITSQIDKIILAHFWGPAQLATYALASAIPNKAIPAIKNLVDIGFPKFALQTKEVISTVFYRRILQGAFFGFIVATIYVVIAPYLFTYLLPQYMDGIFYSQILALGFVFALPNRYISLLFESQKMTHTNFLAGIIASIIGIILYILFGTTYGLMGLVIAGLLHPSFCLILNVTMWEINKTHQIARQSD